MEYGIKKREAITNKIMERRIDQEYRQNDNGIECDGEKGSQGTKGT
jgi:hypothetical protein